MKGLPDAVTDIAHKTEVFFDRPPRPGEVAVVRVSHEQWGPRYLARRHSGGLHVVAYVVRGSGFFEGAAGRVALRSGMVYTRCPGPANTYGCDPDDPLELLMVSALGEGSGALFSRCISQPNHAFAVANAHDVARVMQAMLDQAVKRPPMARRVCNRYFEVLLMLIRQGVLEMPAPNSRPRQTYLQARQYIQDRAERLRSVADVAAYCGVTPAHLCRLFRRFGDDSPHAFLSRLKMNHAARMLANTPMTVKEVADRLGYPDPFSFSKSFKKWHALSPRQYRGSTA